MNRKEFLDTLEKSLSKLPADEKNDAINYYRELFDDAGADNEQQIIDDLGAPEDIAAQILRENGISSEVDPECLPEKTAGEGQNTQGPDITDVKPAKRDNNTLLIIIIVLVLTLPVWGGLLTGFLGAVFGITVAALAILIAFFAAGIALIAAGTALSFNAPPIGLMILGIGLMLFGFSALVIKPVFRGVFKFAVWVVNKLVDAARKIFNKRESVQ